MLEWKSKERFCKNGQQQHSRGQRKSKSPLYVLNKKNKKKKVKVGLWPCIPVSSDKILKKTGSSFI